MVSCEMLSTAGAEYTINVTSQSGNENSNASTVTITAIPNMVLIEAGNSTNSSFTATWNHPAGEIDSFQVFCYENDETPEVITDVGANLTYQVTCESLPTAGTGYNFSVVSVSGNKNATSKIQLYTLPNKVSDLGESGATNDSVSATWTKPDGIVSGYNAICPDGTMLPLTEDAVSVTCTGLPADPGPGGDHTITVVTLSNNKASDPATVIITALPNKVSDLEESGATTDSISATWTKPAGTVSGYNAICPDGTMLPLTEDAVSVTCTGLPADPGPGGDHTITVVTLSNNKASDPATVIITALPNKVSDLEESGATTDSISATWTKPAGTVSGYNAICPDGTMLPLTEDAVSVTCTGLPADPGPGGDHTITVVTLSNNKASDPATVIITALPLSVNLSAGDSLTSSVSAMWPYPGGLVDVFEVDCSNGTESNATVFVGETDLEESYMYLVRCDSVWSPGDNYTMVVTSVSSGKENSASIVLTALPLSVNLVAGNSTTTSVSATWEFPGGVVDEFKVECNNGTKMMSTVGGMGYLASCEELDTPGDNYTMIVTSVSNGQRNSASIVLTALPLSVNLVAGNSTTTSVSATWEFPGGVVDEFEVECNNGTKMMSSVEGMGYLASCEELDTPGDNYTMIVTSVSNGRRNSASIVLTALPLSVNLVAGNSTTTSVSATWEFPGGFVDEFEVECNNGTKMMSNVEGMVYLASCEELDTPGDNYTLIVTSVSNGQRNSASIVLTALPLSVNLVGGNSTTTSVSATWEFPGGVVDEFEVECNNGTKMMSNVEGMVYLASCEELDTPGDNYTMIVTSVSNGQRNSASIVLTALPLSVNLVAGNSTTTSVSATWEFPGGFVDEFEVECNNGTKMMSNVEGMVYLASCEELDTPGDNYTMIVMSVSNGQRNSASIVLTALPLSVNLVAGNSTTTSVSATWEFPGGVVDEFEVECNNGTKMMSGVEGMGYLASCEELDTPGDNYTMIVTSVSNGQRNSASIVLTALPLSVNLVASNSTTTSVSATWEFPGGVVDEFEVECNNGTKMMSGVEGMGYLASCEELDTPGDNYTMIVTSVSNGQRNSASIVLTALPLSVNLVAGNSTTTSVSATWEFPGGVVDEFEVECNNGTKMMSGVEGMVYLASCEELDTPGDNYTMIVTSVSNGQRNSASIILTALPLSVNLVASNSTTTSVSATWEFPGGVVDEFEVECNNGTKIMSTVKGIEYLASCEELDTPGDNYTMIVTSVSNGQRNSASIVLTALPLSVNLFAGNSTTTSVSATWEFPEGVVDEFEVECNNGTKMMSSVEGIGYLASCEELDTPGDNYTVIVTSVSNGQRNSASIVLTALPLSVNLVAGNSTTTSVSATWEFPGGVVDEFEVECNNGTKMMSSVEGMVYLASCEELDTPGDNYTMIVTSVSNGLRNSASIVLTALPLSVNLAAGNSTTTSVSATWEFPGGVVDEFEVECSNGTKMMNSVEGMVYLASCEELDTPGDNYTLIVMSVSNGLRNSASIVLTALPLSVNLVAGNSTTTSVSATWEFPGGVVDEFEVECNNGTKMMSSVEGMGYLASCEELDTPGDNYTMIVTSVSNGQRNSASIVLTALPLSVNLVAGNSTTTSVSATWEFPGGVVDEFEVECNNGTKMMSGVEGMGYLALCEELDTPGDNYTLIVTSVSNGQRNSASIVLTALPLNVDLIPGNSTTTSVTATWQFPGGVVEEFEILCSGGNGTIATVQGMGYLASCEGLDTPGADYTMTVTSLSNSQRNSASIVLTALPEAVTLTEEIDQVTTDKIVASWSNVTGEFDYYEVTCSDGGDPLPSTVNPSDTLEAFCTLTSPQLAGDNYTMFVTTVSNNQRSAVSDITITALPNAVALKEGPSNNTAISATWTISNSLVDTFIITCSDGTASPSSISVASRPQDDDEFTASCVGLPTAGLEYSLTVVARSYGKQSASRTVRVHASPAAVALEEGDSTTTSVSATWNKPESAVDSYTIDCSLGDAFPATIGNTDPEPYTASCMNLTVPGDTYTMTVYSIVDDGNTSTSAYIDLVALPEAVTLTEEIDQVTTDTIVASWSNVNGEFDRYEVNCSDGGNPSPSRVNPSDTLEASCTGLTIPGENYTLSVTTVSIGKRGVALGKEKSSAESPITITAYPNAVNLTATSITTRQIAVQWEDPDGVEDYYKVDCGADGTTNFTVYPSDATENTFEATCNVTEAGADYDIRVTSVSGDKENPITETFTAAPPEEVTFGDSSSNTTSITVTWDLLSGPDGYRVDCSNGKASPSSPLPGSATEVTCTGVTPGGNHSVSVVTLENNGESPAAVDYVVAVPLSAILSANTSTINSVSAIWPYPGGLVEVFEVECSNGTESNTTLTADEGFSYVASCEGVWNPGDNYTMVVTSSSNGEVNPATIVLTALPLSVELTAGNSTTISVSAGWDFPGGVVEEFEVDCSNGTARTYNVCAEYDFVASCEDLYNPGDNYTMTVTSLSNTQRNSAMIVLTALPLSAILSADSSTINSVSAMWPYPGGLVEDFNVECSNGTESNTTLTADEGFSYVASCEGVWNPGDNYTMVVTSSSNGEVNPATIVLTALPLNVELTAGNSTTNSVTAGWDFPGGVVDEFEVDCSNGTARTDNVCAEYDFVALCEDLYNPGDNYTMIVTSLSNTQRNSAMIVMTALPEAVNLTEASESVTTNSIAATWDMPNGIVEYFEVSCSDEGTASPPKVDSSAIRMASCDGLPTPGDDYEISVTSVSYGQRSQTNTITITALPEAVDLEEGDSNTTTISTTWTVPNSVVDTFNITCSEGNASPASISVNDSQQGNTLTAYCTELPRSGEQYTLSVVAISKDKQSATSVIEIYALPKGVDLEEGPSTLTSVNASWTKQNGTVESYSIKCSSGTAYPHTINDTSEESYSAACEDLPDPGDTYNLQVFSEVGTSNNSRASSIIQLVAVPESVEDISVTSYTTTNVTVQWRLKNCSGCVYNYFQLTFKPDTRVPIEEVYISDQVEYTTEVSGLVQGRNYSFSLVSVSGVGVDSATLKTSAAETVEQRTVPATPTELSITPTQRTLTAVWKSVGDVDNFDITVTPNHGSVVFNGNLNQPSAEISDLTPGTTYSVSVVALSGDERSEPKVGSTRTLTDKPSPVRIPLAEVIDKNNIFLTYEAPAEPNGEITHYVISYVGTRGDLPIHESPSFTEIGLTRTVNELRAGFTYVFTIIAVNDGDYESDPAYTEPVTTFQEEPAPVPDNYPYEENTVIPAVSTTSFTVQLPENLFSHDNGELLTFAVIITTEAGDPAVATTTLTFDEARAQSGAAYITSIDNAYPYPLTFESQRKRRATNEAAATVVIGDNICVTDSSKEYCNKPLIDDTEYYYAFRAYNDQGYQTSSTFGPVKTVKDNTTGIAVGVTVSVVTIVMVIVISMVVVKKRRVQEPSPRPSLEGSDNPGFIGPDMEMGNRNKIRRKMGSSMHRKSHSKPILLNDFEDHYKRMKADSDLRFTDEYDEIRQVGKDQAIVAATEMVNRAKNRFTNILPYEHSRVKLAALADEPDSDYINANYMPGFNSPREFIACQGPLPGTVDDVWRMIWEKNTSIVVMLTQLVEKGKIKCHQYWPADYNPVTYGSIQVSIQAIQQYDHWVIREFSVAQGNEIRKLTQYHFMSWPDHGVPDHTITMLDFVRTVRDAIRKEASEQPIVAHCSAGVGRTGTYIALDRLMQVMQENDFIDIFGIICEMRMQRNHMVQTEKQYIFIHECVMDLLQRGDDEMDNGESLYVNLPANGFGHEDVSQTLLDQAV
ncbi:receptor-type tyrosine-protein phosphatase beta-like [Lytechinus pictus]|uniref:receptor-type tyrosine-protein phosphatase beta-like n=1 Tax=Lytechinus pictus TaxID=7653 RepID=UPI0030B9E198